MKRIWSLVLALCMALGLAACAGNGGETPGETAKSTRADVSWTFGTGDTGGSMYPAGAAVSRCWTNNVEGMSCEPQVSTGSFQNVQDVANGEVEVAVATADVVLDGYNGTGRFADIGALNNICVIGAVYTSVLSGVALRASGIRHAHDLIGRRVAVGPASSATEKAALTALGVMGIDGDNTTLENLGLGDGADAVGSGEVDAAFGFAGLPIGGQLSLAATSEISVLDMTDGELDRVLADNAAYVKTAIPAGTYPGVDYDIQTFGVKCLIIVQKDADEQLVYELCKAMNEGAAELAAGNALLREMTDPAFLCARMPIPLHHGAERYYTEIGAI